MRTKEEINAYHRAWRKANPDKVKANMQRFRSRHGDRLRRYELDRYHALPLIERNRRRWRRLYKISPEERQEMWQAQEGKCKICGVVAELHLDHDHTTGAVRALLCANCNRGIGQLKDDPGLLEAAAAYLRSFDRRA